MARKFLNEQIDEAEELREAQVAPEAPAPVVVAQAPAPVAAAPKPMKLDFDAWWAMREKKVPQHHLKEIILADFQARKLSLQETMQTYDEALRKYGVKLK